MNCPIYPFTVGVKFIGSEKVHVSILSEKYQYLLTYQSEKIYILEINFKTSTDLVSWLIGGSRQAVSINQALKSKHCCTEKYF